MVGDVFPEATVVEVVVCVVPLVIEVVAVVPPVLTPLPLATRGINGSGAYVKAELLSKVVGNVLVVVVED